MQTIRSKDTKPELRVRRLLHAMGYRFRVHLKDLAGKPDIAFTRRRKVTFVHGCFWHGHQANDCPDGSRPRSNTGYWNPKLDRNAERDRANADAIEAAGWDVLTVWACETLDEDALRGRMAAFLGNSVADAGERRAER